MVIDTSAFVAVLLEEPSADDVGPAMLQEPNVMASPNALECHMVLTKHYGDETRQIIQRRFAELGITVVQFGPEHLSEATRAFDIYGKGRHRAALNFGDCIAYALSKVSGQRLLYVGDDFDLTDVRR